jgi:hypothetical protein
MGHTLLMAEADPAKPRVTGERKTPESDCHSAASGPLGVETTNIVRCVGEATAGRTIAMLETTISERGSQVQVSTACRVGDSSPTIGTSGSSPSGVNLSTSA